MNRPFPWEASYPPGLSWDAPLLVETLPAMLDRAVREYGDQCYIEFRGQEISFRELGPPGRPRGGRACSAWA